MDNYKKEIISAFAFKTGKKIEELINEHTNELHERNNALEAKILQWYMKTKDKDFGDHMGIVNMDRGHVPTILERHIQERSDIMIREDGQICFVSGMTASADQLAGLNIDDAEDRHKRTRNRTGYGARDAIKLLSDNDWDVEKAVKNAVKWHNRLYGI